MSLLLPFLPSSTPRPPIISVTQLRQNENYVLYYINLARKEHIKSLNVPFCIFHDGQKGLSS
jgi:hypothetical protein